MEEVGYLDHANFLHFTGDNFLSGDSSQGGLSPASSSQLEVVAPVTADVEFKYTWPIDGFVNQVKNGNSSSLSSNGEPIYSKGVVNIKKLSY